MPCRHASDNNRNSALGCAAFQRQTAYCTPVRVTGSADDCRSIYGPPPDCKKNRFRREQSVKMYLATEWTVIRREEESGFTDTDRICSGCGRRVFGQDSATLSDSEPSLREMSEPALRQTLGSIQEVAKELILFANS